MVFEHVSIVLECDPEVNPYAATWTLHLPLPCTIQHLIGRQSIDNQSGVS